MDWHSYTVKGSWILRAAGISRLSILTKHPKKLPRRNRKTKTPKPQRWTVLTMSLGAQNARCTSAPRLANDLVRCILPSVHEVFQHRIVEPEARKALTLIRDPAAPNLRDELQLEFRRRNKSTNTTQVFGGDGECLRSRCWL